MVTNLRLSEADPVVIQDLSLGRIVSSDNGASTVLCDAIQHQHNTQHTQQQHPTPDNTNTNTNITIRPRFSFSLHELCTVALHDNRLEAFDGGFFARKNEGSALVPRAPSKVHVSRRGCERSEQNLWELSKNFRASLRAPHINP